MINAHFDKIYMTIMSFHCAPHWAYNNHIQWEMQQKPAMAARK